MATDVEQMRTLVLERLKVRTMGRFSNELLRTAKLDAARSDLYAFMADELVLGLTAYMFASKPHVRATDYVQEPRTWWDALKLRLASVVERHGAWMDERLADWIRSRVQWRRIPVKFLEQHCCPHLNLAVPEHARTLAIHREERHLAWMEDEGPEAPERAQLQAALDAIRILAREGDLPGLFGHTRLIERIAQYPDQAGELMARFHGPRESCPPHGDWQRQRDGRRCGKCGTVEHGKPKGG